MEASQKTSHSQIFQVVSEGSEAFVHSQCLLSIGAAKSKEIGFHFLAFGSLYLVMNYLNSPGLSCRHMGQLMSVGSPTYAMEHSSEYERYMFII